MRDKIAFVTEKCTGCAGAPVCRIYCPKGAFELTEDRDNYPFKRMRVNPERCSACGACIARGPGGSRLLGCPWDAICMIAAYAAEEREKGKGERE